MKTIPKTFSNFTKKRKTNCFQTNINDLKKTLKVTKDVICRSELSNSVPSAVIESDVTLTNPQENTNSFNKYFIKYFKHYSAPIKFSRKKIIGIPY